MRRLGIIVALLLVPAAAPAQVRSTPAPPVVSITPIVGARVPFRETVSVFVPEGEVLLRQDRTGGALIGADAAIRAGGRWSLLAGAAYGGRGAVHYFLPGTGYADAPDWVSYSDNAFWVGKAGISARFEAPRSLGDTRRLPATDLSAGAAFVNDFGHFHPALNFGFLGSVPLAPGIQVVLGIEDYLTFWDESTLTPVISDLITQAAQEDIQSVVLRYRSSNVLQLRLGFSFSL